MAQPGMKLWTDAFFAQVNPALVSVGLHKALPGWQSPPRHTVMPDFDLWYVAAGAGEISLAGKWHPISAGELITLTPGMVCTGERASAADPYQVYFAHLLPFGAPHPAGDAALAAAWPMRLSVLHRPELLPVFDRLLAAAALADGRPSLRVRGLLLELLDVVFEELQGGPPGGGAAALRQVLAARGFIETHFAEAIGVADIAAHVGLSPSHLSALFARHLGLPPNACLIETRLREAKVLLARGESVKRTARAVGFNSQHYFSRLFHQRTGLSPTAFAAAYARDERGVD
jgi:AraC family transcriptional regulator of arabinose operon